MSSRQSGEDQKLELDTVFDTALRLMFEDRNNGKNPRMLGLEIELPFFNEKDLTPISFNGKGGITSIFNALSKKSNWQVHERENGKITALKGQAGVITLEPGGQIELSSHPRKTLSELSDDVDTYVSDFEDICAKLGINAIPFGFHPHTSVEDCPYIDERSRFAALKPLFDAGDEHPLWVQTCSVQVTLDCRDAKAAFDYFKLGLAIQPFATAMFANSPFSEGADSGYKSWRWHKLQSIRSPIYSVPEGITEAGYTAEEWVEHILSLPMSFIVRDDKYIPVAANSFRDMVDKPLPELAHLPEDERFLTERDLMDHLTSIKPEIFLKPGFLLEFRAADVGPTPEHWKSVAAFWMGIFYDDQARLDAASYLTRLTTPEIEFFRQNVAKEGLQTSVGGKTAQDIAMNLIAISKSGLARLQSGSESFLDIIEAQVRAGVSSADMALQDHKMNGGDIEKTLKEGFLFPRTGKTRHLKIGKN